MNLSGSVSANMDYIQRLFLSVQDFMQKSHEPGELMSFLDAEPPRFRSVAYESASMEIGMMDLITGNGLNNWKLFYHHAARSILFIWTLALDGHLLKSGYRRFLTWNPCTR
ncbi:MAG: hypothetical protein IPQ06_04590 [Chitinophagaceae bacterium]|nr:hypothetical protein [Chitinophagaceae bacterium]